MVVEINNLDFTLNNTLEPKKGRLLLSEPFLDDDYFSRSVVLLCEHNEEGSFGFVLNNYLEINLYDYAKNFPVIDTKISMGGPVEGQNIYFIHTIQDLLPGSIPITENVFMGGEYDLLLQLIKDGKVDNSQVRFFLGYSGWEPNQLQEELDVDSWLVVEPDENDLMDIFFTDIWNSYFKRQGKKYEVISRFPRNPQDN